MNIIKTDVIVSWPIGCDYPLWRKFITENRERFNKVIVAFSFAYGSYDFTSFIIHNFNCGITYLIADMPDTRDWRDVCVNKGIDNCNGEWIWFTEQDFLPEERYLDEVRKRIDMGADVVGEKVGNRLHPCSIFIKRDLVNKTKRNFGVKTNELDHFGLFQKDIERLNFKLEIIEEMGEHMNGLSGNFGLISRGEQPNYQPERFRRYVEECLGSGVILDDRFRLICTRYLYG